MVCRLNQCECAACGDGFWYDGQRRAEKTCRLACCALERLGWATLVELVAALAPDRAVDAPSESFEWEVPDAAKFAINEQFECRQGLTVAAPDGVVFGFNVSVTPTTKDGSGFAAKVRVQATASSGLRVLAEAVQDGAALPGSWIKTTLASGECGYNTAVLMLGECGSASTPLQGTLRGTVKVCLASSTAQRTAVLEWAKGNGFSSLSSSVEVEVELLAFLEKKALLQQGDSQVTMLEIGTI